MQNLFPRPNKYYQNNYLWPIIFTENANQISHPDVLSPAITLDIPGFDGTPPNFTNADSTKIASSNVQAYMAYKRHKNDKARDYLWVANRYDPNIVQKYESQIDSEDLKYATNRR